MPFSTPDSDRQAFLSDPKGNTAVADAPQPIAPTPQASSPTSKTSTPFQTPAKDIDPSFDPAAFYNEAPSQQRMAAAVQAARARAQNPQSFGQQAMQFGKGVVQGLPGAIKGFAGGTWNLGKNLLTSAFGSKDDAEKSSRETASALQLGALQGVQGVIDAGHKIGQLIGLAKSDRDLTDQEWQDRIQHQAALLSVAKEISNGNLQGDWYKRFSRVKGDVQTDPEKVGQMSFIGDPRTYMLGPAAEVAGPAISRFITAPALRGAGAAVEGVGNVLKAATGGHNVGLGLGYSLLAHSPLDAALVFGSKVAAKNLPGLGKTIAEAGAEAGGAAAPLGQSLVTKGFKAGLQGAVTGGVLSTPYALAAKNPEEAGEAVGGGLGLGGVMGAFGGIKNARTTEIGAKAAALAKQGAAINYGMGVDDIHNRWMQTLPPEAQQAINTYRGAFNGFTNKDGIPVQIYVAGGKDYARLGGGSATDTPGFITKDGSKVVLNADVAKQTGEINGPIAHEAAGHLVEYLADIYKTHGISTLTDAIERAVKNNPSYQRFVKGQIQSLMGDNPTPEHRAFIENAIAEPRYFEKEFLAQHAVEIMKGTNIADFTLPPKLKSDMVTGVRNWLRTQGILPKTGGDIGWGGNEVKEITDQLRDLLYKQGAQGEAIRGQGPQSPTVAARMRQLEAILSNPPTAQSPVDSVKTYTDAQAEYQRLQKGMVAPFPASGPAPVAPQTPGIAPQAPGSPVPAPEDLQTRMARSDTLDALKSPQLKGVIPPEQHQARVDAAIAAAKAQGIPITAENLLTFATTGKFQVEPPKTNVPPPTAADGEKVPEHIVSPAIRLPDGTIHTGENHTKILRTIGSHYSLRQTDAAGFVTNTGRFVSREEAAQIAKDTGQVVDTNKPNELHSQDLEKPATPEPTTVPGIPSGIGKDVGREGVATGVLTEEEKANAPQTERIAAALTQAQSEHADYIANRVAIRPEGINLTTKEGRAWKKEQLDAGKEILTQEEAERKRWEAMAKAHAKVVGKTDLVTWRPDKYVPDQGTISGTKLDTADPFHQEIFKRQGWTQADINKAIELQNRTDVASGIEYLSAPDDPGAKAAYSELENQQNAQLRRAAQEKAKATDRAGGQAPFTRQMKSYIFKGWKMNLPSGSVEAEGFSPDKILANAAKVIPYLETKGVKSYTSADDPQLVQDIKDYAENNKNGWTGDGRKKVEGTPLTPVKATPGYEPKVIPNARFRVLNAIMGDESAFMLNEKGQPKAGSDRDKMARREKQTLAQMNVLDYNPQTGQTNWVRNLMREDGDFKFMFKGAHQPFGEFSGPRLLESAWENLKPELIENISTDPNIANEHTVRPSGFSGDLSQLSGTPRGDFVAGGFMPATREDMVGDMTGQRDWMQRELAARGKSPDDPDAVLSLSPQWRAYHAREKDGAFLQNSAYDSLSQKLYANQPENRSSIPQNPQNDPFGAATAYIRGASEASAGAKGVSGDQGAKERTVLVDWARQNGLLISKWPKRYQLGGTRDVGNSEHHVFFDNPPNRVLKVTKGTGTKIGYSVAPGEIRDWVLKSALPSEYLQRMQDQNELTGDDVRLHGVYQDKHGNVGIVTSQPAIKGNVPTDKWVRESMEVSGFKSLGDSGYYRASDDTLMADVNPGNVLEVNGALVPFDAIVVKNAKQRGINVK